MLDQAQRLEALNTQKSFIIQSPAGSGKTELLVQRYLALLSQSSHPENVVAVTFTKKAAAEMRRRVLTALQEVASDQEAFSEIQPNIRLQLARKLYQWQKKCGWNLLVYPNRLRIQTIDAFYRNLVAQTPLLSGLGTAPKISANPTKLYQKAVQILLAQLETAGALSEVLSHFLAQLDNDHAQVEALLVPMLARRDQWLPFLEESSDFHSLRRHLEGTLQSIYEAKWRQVDTVFSTCGELPQDWRCQLRALVEFSGLYKKENEEDLGAFWKAALALLITSEGKWRQVVTGKQGFPSEKEAKTKEEKPLYKAMKQQFGALMSTLSDQDELLAALLSLRQAPALLYTEPQWEWLKVLFYILKALTHILHTVFQTHRQSDYIEVSLRALHAVGDAQAPTDLMLALDYQIQHILVDEFQDTSVHQLELLKRLIEGWQPQDSRTLFLVGDPMQSIYRFRKAEVRLFKQVIAQGIGACALERLTLSTNFRSVPRLIHWVNSHFSRITQQSASNIFSPAQAFKASGNALEETENLDNHHENVFTHWLLNVTEQEEAKKVVEITQEALQFSDNIAILARTRRHLFPILMQLKLANIPFNAVEVTSFTQNPVIQDLLALTRALVHLADETAWFAILRAPWCGLSLYDLHAIRQRSLDAFIWENLLILSHQEKMQLTKEGQERLKRIMPILSFAIEQKGRIPLDTLVKQTWLALGGPASLDNAFLSEESQEVEFFFQFIAQMQVGEDIVDFDALENALNQSYAQSQTNEANVSVMTIHKAKGLEFDVVILPGLHRTPPAEARSLLLYGEYVSMASPEPRLVIAPIQSPHELEEGTEPIYCYLQSEERTHRQAEAIRLFYVACTRAKKCLHLVGVLRTESMEKNQIVPPKESSFLKMLWPHLNATQKVPMALAKESSEYLESTPTSHAYPLKRIASSSLRFPFPFESKRSKENDSSFSWQWKATTPEQSIGVVTHQLLYYLAQRKLSESALFEQRFELIAHYQPIIRSLLLQARLNPNLVEKSVIHVVQAVRNTLEDPRGCWILSGHHQAARSEYALTYIEKVDTLLPKSKQIILDRTFIDEQGVRWIIDYKTTQLVGQDRAGFIPHQQIQHQAQLAAYAEAIQALTPSIKTPIQLGLYWPGLRLWHAWEFNEVRLS